jgi:hypothetical protein
MALTIKPVYGTAESIYSGYGIYEGDLRIAISYTIEDGERIVAALDAVDTLAQVAAERDAALGEVEWLRAYALALRGDLIDIDGASSENDWDRVESAVGRHLRGTLNEDVAALAGERQT